MVHHVIDEVDAGESIVVKEVNCVEGESLEDLTERMRRVEHAVIVDGTRVAIERLWEKRRLLGYLES